MRSAELEAKIREGHAAGLNDTKLSAVLGFSNNTIGKYRRALGLRPNTGQGPNIKALKEESRLGCCVACDSPLPPKRGVCCGHQECVGVVMTAYFADRSIRRALKKGAPQ